MQNFKIIKMAQQKHLTKKLFSKHGFVQDDVYVLNFYKLGTSLRFLSRSTEFYFSPSNFFHSERFSIEKDVRYFTFEKKLFNLNIKLHEIIKN